MKNNTTTNILLGIIALALIMIVALLFTHQNSPNPAITHTSTNITNTPNISSSQQENTQVSNNSSSQQSSISMWGATTTPGFIVSYNTAWTVSPYMYAPPASQNNPQMTGYRFYLPSGNIIEWGGPQASCPSENQQFQYGISVEACVKNLDARLQLQNVRFSLTQADKNAFGDFVQHNQ